MNTNQIICGESANVLSECSSNSIDLVVTDPPYLCNYKDRFGRTVANDDSPEAVLKVFDQIYRVMKQDSYCVSFYGWTGIIDFAHKWEECGFKVVGHIAWAKKYTSKTRYLNYQHESAFVLAKGNPEAPSNPINDVQPWEYTGNKSHPTEKAVNVVKPLIQSFSNIGDIVLDPFCGAGSVPVASALTDRQYIGIELEQKYCNITRQRLAGVERWKNQQAA